MQKCSNWQWRLNEVFMKITRKRHYLWRTVDHEGEIIESYVTKRRDRKAALKFVRKSIKRYDQSKVILAGRPASYQTAIKIIGNADRQETERWLNNQAEN